MSVPTPTQVFPGHRFPGLSEKHVEERGLFNFAEELRRNAEAPQEASDDPIKAENGDAVRVSDAVKEGRTAKTSDEDQKPAEPWFMEMGHLRRMYFLYLNKQLALKRKALFESKKATDEDMVTLGALLHEQAEAIRDFQYIRRLDWLSEKEKREREDQCKHFFPFTNKSTDPRVSPFRSDNYRRLPPDPQQPIDGVREWLRKHLFVQLTYSAEDKKARKERYIDRKPPRRLSSAGDKIARFIVAFVGALFILVPMYIMALHTSRTKNLITTTVAVLLFALVCSITLRTTNDQTLSATAGYAAVLFVFVGLTSVPQTNN